MNANANGPELSPRLRAIEAFVALATESLEQIEACISALARQDEAEGAHALRVAVRRARALRWAFGPALPAQMNARWRDALAGLMRNAGELRDWDVFFEQTLDPACEAAPDNCVLAGIRAIACRRREDCRRTLLAQLEAFCHWPAPVLRQDLDTLRQAGASPSLPQPPALPRLARARIGKFGRRRVRKARRQVRRLAHCARRGKPRHEGLEALHRLRIAGKRLRYLIEALAPVLPPRYADGLRSKLVKQQTRLGQQLDDAVARRLLTECLMSPEAHRSATIST